MGLKNKKNLQITYMHGSHYENGIDDKDLKYYEEMNKHLGFEIMRHKYFLLILTVYFL